MEVTDHSSVHPRADLTLMPLVAELKDLLARPEDLAGHAVHPGPALRLLDVYLQSLTSLNEPPSELAPIIRLHLLDLVAAAIEPTTEAAAIVAKRGVKAARVRAILREIARRFSDPEFELDTVARSLGLSRRYVQQLLKETGKSFTEHLVEHRLERSFAMLNHRRCLHLMIIDIAFAAGFWRRLSFQSRVPPAVRRHAVEDSGFSLRAWAEAARSPAWRLNQTSSAVLSSRPRCAVSR